MSLDGFIARKDGSYDWIEGHGTNKYDTPLQFDNPSFFQSCDTVGIAMLRYDRRNHSRMN